MDWNAADDLKEILNRLYPNNNKHPLQGIYGGNTS